MLDVERIYYISFVTRLTDWLAEWRRYSVSTLAADTQAHCPFRLQRVHLTVTVADVVIPPTEFVHFLFCDFFSIFSLFLLSLTAFLHFLLVAPLICPSMSTAARLFTRREINARKKKRRDPDKNEWLWAKQMARKMIHSVRGKWNAVTRTNMRKQINSL